MAYDSSIVSKLVCPKCNGSVIATSRAAFDCAGCSSHYTIDNDIIDFLIDKSKKTQLEEIDYDAVGGISEKAIENIGAAWITVFENAGLDLNNKSVLEIGSGTGALTLGLLTQTQARHIFATDISEKFLRKTLDRAGPDPRLTFLRCDCNDMPIRDGSFDLVVGRSILHHLIDYELVLTKCAQILDANGKAIFFEPILEGKIIIAFFAELISNLADRFKDRKLNDRDRKIIRANVRHITKESWYPQDRESLTKIEDKFIFTLSTMREVGLRAGFKSVEFLRDNRKPDQTYWSYFVHNMRVAGIEPSKLKKYEFISTTYRNTIGAFPEMFYEPMGYFCFEK